jgi:predicted dehydrogenase
MVDPFYDYTQQYDSVPPHGIGVIGAGEIVSAVHLPAYEQAGFDVVGVFDRDPERTEEVASEHGIRAYPDRTALLEDPAVTVVDIAVPPHAQRAVVEAAAGAGKHVLCQKPLADTFENARAIVRAVADGDIVGAVNQQMRWEKSIRATRELLDEGMLGTPLRAKIEVNIDTAWTEETWQSGLSRLEVMQHSIHYLDSFRYLFGEPKRVEATMARAPDQAACAETRTIQVLEYAGDLRATIDANHNNWAEEYAEFRFEGTEGIIRGTLGFIDEYPAGGTDRFEYRSLDGSGESHDIPNAWFPDAFIGTMGSLLEAIDGGTPLTAVEDNLETFRLANAVYRAASERKAVEPTTVETDYYPPFVDC